MDHEADVGLADPHPEGDGRDDDPDVVKNERFLNAVPLGSLEGINHGAYPGTPGTESIPRIRVGRLVDVRAARGQMGVGGQTSQRDY